VGALVVDHAVVGVLDAVERSRDPVSIAAGCTSNADDSTLRCC